MFFGIILKTLIWPIKSVVSTIMKIVFDDEMINKHALKTNQAHTQKLYL